MLRSVEDWVIFSISELNRAFNGSHVCMFMIDHKVLWRIGCAIAISEGLKNDGVVCNLQMRGARVPISASVRIDLGSMRDYF